MVFLQFQESNLQAWETEQQLRESEAILNKHTIDYSGHYLCSLLKNDRLKRQFKFKQLTL